MDKQPSGAPPKAPQCDSVARRISFDKRKGFTTSQRAVDFIRRTCPCDLCYAWRALGQQLPVRPQAVEAPKGQA